MSPELLSRQRVLLLVLALVRPAFVFLVLTIAFIGSAQAGLSTDSRVAFTLALSIVGWSLFAATINDLGDRDVDRANLGHTGGRPLAKEGADRRLPVVVLAASAIVSLGAAATLSLATTLVMLNGLGLAAAYSLPPLRLSARGTLTSLILPSIYVGVPFLAGRWAVDTSFGNNDLIVVIGLYVSFIGRLLLKDFRDHLGDQLYGKRTFLVRHGRRRTCAVSLVLWVVGAALLAVSQQSASLAALWIPLAAIAVVYIVKVGNDEWGNGDVYNITVIAIVGRGTLLMLLANVGMDQVRGGAMAWWAVQAGLALVTVMSAARFALATRQHGASPLPANLDFPAPKWTSASAIVRSGE